MYQRMSTEDFLLKLSENSYPTASAARRAIGKSAFSKSEKEKCYAAIDKKFGAAASKSKKTKKAVKKKKKTKPKKRARKTSSPPSGSFLVAFARLAKDEVQRGNVVDFLKLADTDGRSLSDLIDALEAVDQ